MAGCADLFHFGKQGVFVTVHGQGLHILEMPGCLSFDPLALTAPAVISHAPGLYSIVERFFIHIGHHKHFICLIVLDDHRDQPVGIQFEFAEIQDALKGGHLDPGIGAYILELVKIHVQVAYKQSGYALDTVALQDAKDLALLHRIGEYDAGKFGDVHDRVKVKPVHEYDLRAEFFDQMLLFEQRIKIIEGYRDPLFAEPLGHLPDQVDGKRF